MKKKYLWIMLIAIVVLASILRLWQLGNIPPSPDWDEAAIGYDAYSIINTGSDQFGKFLPVVLRSLDDYKPAFYAYLTIPSILVFGLNVFAVRLPSAIFGILSVLAVFYLVRQIFENYKYKDHLSLLSSFFLAISPWSIQFSRVGFESNVGTALNIFAALFFLKGLKKPWVLSLSAIFAAFSIYTYQSEKVFTPLLILVLALIYWKKLFSINKKYLALALITGIIAISPMILYLFNDQTSLARVTKTSIFTSQTEILKINIQKLARDKANNDMLGIVLDNRRVVYAKTALEGYLTHLDLNWLFLKGDNERHHAPNMGLLYLFELPFFLFGIYKLIFSGFERSAKLLVFSWFLIAPLPASITTGLPHAVRTLNFLPTFQIFTAIGVVAFAIFILNMKYKIANIQIKYLIFALCFLFLIFNFSYYINQYFVQLNYYDSGYWQYGYKEAIDKANVIGNKYKQIVVSNDKKLDKSYIFFLYYLKYPPNEYQKLVRNRTGEIINTSFGKFEFRPIDWKKDSLLKNVLYIANPSEIPDGVKTIKTIYNLDGTPAIKMVGT